MPLAPSSAAQWAAAAATTVAVLVALFKDEFWRRVRRPVLTLRILSESPDCIITPMRRIADGEVVGRALWLRLWIENTGGLRAEKVQVYLSEVCRRQANLTYAPIDGFTPMNLRWSNTDFGRPEIYADGISPKMGKHCDLGRILGPIEGAANPESNLELWVEVFPANQTNQLSPGWYELEIKTAGSNCGPFTQRLRLNVVGEWFEDERQMLRQGIGIEAL